MPIRRLSIIAAAVAMLAAVAGPARGVIPESEPNDGFTQPDLLSGYPCYEQGTGDIGDGGSNDDFWSIATPRNAQVWALVDPTGADDTVLTLRRPDMSLFERDEDDATGTGGDMTIETTMSSVLAGVHVATGGTGFLQVEENGGDAPFDGYRLYATVTKGHVAEVEPNDQFSAANPIVRCPHVRSGEITLGGDVDVYAVAVPDHTTLFLALDADPGRNGAADLVLRLFDKDASTELMVANSSGALPAAAEGFIFDLEPAGTYYVSVAPLASGGGDYRLLVSGLPTASCGGRVATMTGSPADDLIEGVDGADRIAALEGRDEISGDRGKDRLCGGRNGDLIRGERGRDRLYGGRGPDILRGGRSRDRLRGNRGDDQLFGGRRADVCFGGQGSDSTNSC